MKIFYTLLMSLFLLFTANATMNQAILGNLQDEKTIQKKAQNNNTVRSNRTDDKTSVGPTDPNSSSPTSTGKKGYDYYKAQSDLNSAGAKGKVQDHNSYRSNKSSSSVATDPLNSDNDSTSTVKKGNHNSVRSNRTTNQEPGKK